MSRLSLKEQYHFVEISYGSLMEVLCQLTLANDLEYITEEELLHERQHIEDVAKLLSGLRSSIDKRLNENTQH